MSAWVDSHVHLQDGVFGEGLNGVVDVLRNEGVGVWGVNGTGVDDWELVDELAQEYAEVVPFYGVHPWKVHEMEECDVETLGSYIESRWKADLPVGLGEVGLCAWKDRKGLDRQEEVLREQLRLVKAEGWDVPISVHGLQAWGRLETVIREEGWDGMRFLLHAYSGPIEMVKRWVELGAFFSFNAYFLHERKEKVREVFRALPEERLLVESDAPSMCPPEDLRRWTVEGGDEASNHPVHVILAGEALAELREVEVDRLREVLEKNWEEFLG